MNLLNLLFILNYNIYLFRKGYFLSITLPPKVYYEPLLSRVEIQHKQMKENYSFSLPEVI